VKRRLATVAALLLAALAVLGLTASAEVFAAPADLTDSITATVSGTATTAPTHGVLYVYDNVTALHHTRSVVYYMHDGYSKTVELRNSARPYGVVLRQEDIANACDSSSTDGSVNPVGGYESGTGALCGTQLHLTKPLGQRQLGGDLIGRFCRVPQAGFHLPCPLNIHVTEAATGSGQYLATGAKDHGGMMEVDYYCNVAGVDHEVNVKLPAVAATDYGGKSLTTQALITEIVLLPQSGPVPTAVLELQ